VDHVELGAAPAALARPRVRDGGLLGDEGDQIALDPSEPTARAVDVGVEVA
jgi:hypothetical protein